MKIVQIVTQMEAGGAQRVAMLLGEALQKRGYQAEVWFLYQKRPTYAKVPGVRVLLDHKPSASDYIKIVFKLQQLLRSHKPDVLIAHTHYANVLGQFVAKLCGVPIRIAVQHNPLSTYPKAANWVDKFLGTKAFYTANIAVSQVVVDSAEKYPPAYKKILKKIYNGVPPQKIDNSRKDVRNRWGLPENAPLIVNVGRLARQKNQAVLLEALLKLPDAHLIVIGEGELRDALEKKVAELELQQRVHLLGELESRDVLGLLGASDVFVFPSLYEAMPMALVEAMGAGLPVVAGDIPAMREVLGDAGILVPSESAEEIAKAVRQVLDAPEKASRMRQSSIERARVFSVEKMVESYETVFS